MNKSWLLILGSVFFVTGCATHQDLPMSFCGVQRDDPLVRFDAKKMLGEMVEPMCSPIQAATTVPVVLAHPVDLQTLKVDSKGLIWGEVLKERVTNQCQVKVREAQFSQNLQLSSNGITALSRDLAQLASPQFPLEVVVAATVEHQHQSTRLHVRAIDVSSQVILAEQSRTITWACQKAPDGLASVQYFVN